MSPLFRILLVTAAVVACCARTAAAGIICGDSSYVTVQYAAGARLTISPGPDGETLKQRGINVTVHLKHCKNGVPMVGASMAAQLAGSCP